MHQIRPHALTTPTVRINQQIDKLQNPFYSCKEVLELYGDRIEITTVPINSRRILKISNVTNPSPKSGPCEFVTHCLIHTSCSPIDYHHTDICKSYKLQNEIVASKLDDFLENGCLRKQYYLWED